MTVPNLPQAARAILPGKAERGFTTRAIRHGYDPADFSGSVQPPDAGYSTVTLLARLRGWSTSVPLSTAVW
jgi:hypothetical protein